jgi:hypothetical protein
MPVTPASIWLSCTPPTAICCTSSCRRRRTSVPISTAAALKTAPVWCWKWLMPYAKSGAPTVSASASRQSAASRTSITARTKKPTRCI